MPGAYTDQLLTEIVYQDGTAVAKVGGANGGGINFKAPLTATPNGITGNVDVGISGSPPLGNVTATSVTVGPETWQEEPAVLTTDGSVVNLLSAALPIPAAGTLRYRATIEATIRSYAHTFEATWTEAVKWKRDGTGAPVLAYSNAIAAESGINDSKGGTGNTFALIDGAGTSITISGAANNGSGKIQLTLSGIQTGILSGNIGTVANVGGVPNATGTWGLVYVDSTHVDLVGSTFAGTYTSGGTITIGGVVSQGIAIGNTAQIQASGILPAPWVSGESFSVPGAVRYDSVSGNTYIYTGTGTTSSRPTGTTSGSDGGLTYDFLAVGQHCPITWQVTDLEYATQ